MTLTTMTYTADRGIARITRHTPEGYAFQQRAQEAAFMQAVRERDEPFGDFGGQPRASYFLVTDGLPGRSAVGHRSLSPG